MRFSLILFIFCCLAIQVEAATVQKINGAHVDPAKKITLKKDSSNVELRKIDEAAVTKYSKQKEFNYEEVKPADSWWDKFWRAVWRFLNRLFSGSSKPDGANPILMQIVKYFLVALAIAIVVFVVVKVLGLDLKFLTGRSKTIEVPYEETLENIHEINFDEQLENALNEGNYRLAVRLLYLRTLKQLSDQQLIVWQPEKTNQAYVAELGRGNLRSENAAEEFAQLTLQFEYIWYGDFYIDTASFEPIRSSFQQFNQEIK